MTRKAVVAALLFTSVSTVACGHTAYRSSVNAAEAHLAEAREKGAEDGAPYEFYFARERLVRAENARSAEDAAAADVLAQKAVSLPKP